MAGAIGAGTSCIFCEIATKSSSTPLLHSDDKVVAFQDINPSAFRHYLVIPVEHIPTVKNLQTKSEHYSLVSHMLEVGRTLLLRDAPQSKHYRFGFHQPPLNSVNHLHLHCLALPYTPRYLFIFLVTVCLSMSYMLLRYLNLPLHELKQMEMYKILVFRTTWFH